MKKPALLYSSAEIHSRIKRVLGQPSTGDQRVALVAYIGSDGERYLPHPDGLRLICNPSAGGTDPDTLRRLIKRGAKVELSERLHMKVYWSRNRGCVITSANASSSALGRSGLKEAGIWLPAGKVDIRRFIQYAHPRPVKEADLRQLDTKSREHKKNFRDKRGRKNAAPGFLEWYSSPYRPWWKLTWIDKEVSGTATTVKEQTSTEYGHKKPDLWVSTRKNRVQRNDWLLLFTFSAHGVKAVHWMFIDLVVRISPKEKRYYEHGRPYHAVQVSPASKYPLPPFQITARFRKALSAAIETYTPERIKDAKTDIPSVRLIDLIERELKSR